ncbi:MAG: phospholipid carrier-dependent glycosyltransferase, partial [Chloroflexota bacterium]
EEGAMNRFLLPPPAAAIARWGWYLSIGIVVLMSLTLNLANNDFPLRYHFDEINKVQLISTDEVYFKHPLLMTQTSKFINHFLALTEPQEVVQLGRSVNGVMAAATVLLCFVLFRTAMRAWLALLAAFTVGTSPIMVVHAHYLKEDVLLTFFLLLSLFLLLLLVNSVLAGDIRNKRLALLLGVSTGLALSSHYKGGVLVLLFAAVPLVLRGTLDVKAYRRQILLVLGIALGVFLLVNHSLLSHLHKFKGDFAFEFRHALKGHDVRVYPWQFFFGFHFVYSLVPGLTVVVAIAGLLGYFHTLIRWTKIDWRLKILALYTGIFYLVPEASPLKPFPDYMRYMLPVAPLFIFFSYLLLGNLYSSAPRFAGRAAVVAVMLSVATLPLPRTFALVNCLTRDTRAQAEEWVKLSGAEARFEVYSSASRQDIGKLWKLDLDRERASGVTHVVSSSLMYERYEFGAGLAGQPPEIYAAAAKYRELFSLPYIEIKPECMTFAFSNPTIRIIDIRGTRPPVRSSVTIPPRDGVPGQ